MLTRPEAATLALFELGGDRETQLTEDIAIRAAEIAPGMFAWQKHRERIDKELVRVALSDARLKAGYVVGSHAKGWMLTANGIEFARNKASAPKQPTSQRASPDDRRWDKERSRLLQSDAFLRLSGEGSDAVTDDEADAFFRLNVYVQGEARDRKIARLENHFMNDPELADAVRQMAARARARG